MPITTITLQPGSGITAKIAAAYRPVVFKVTATRTDGNRIPPVVYCDIYFNNVYYKSLAATQFDRLNTANSEWKFDISDASQEYLKGEAPTNGGSVILNPTRPAAAVFVRFRSSGYDTNGFQVPEGIAPVRATGSNPPVAGTGTESESFYVINATLQHEDNQDLQAHLEHSRPNVFFNASLFPLTHRPNGYTICKGDSDYYPIVYLGGQSFGKLCLTYKNKITGALTTVCHTYPLTCSSVVSNVLPIVQSNNDVGVTFDSIGTATVWEWTIDGGNTWNVVTAKAFTIVFYDLLVRLITEAGLEVITENGQIIIPENINPFTSYTLTVRPRCANGAYGTSGSFGFTIPPPSSCGVPTVFSLNSANYTTDVINLNMTLPGGNTNFDLEWRFDYGGGFITAPLIQNDTLTGSPFAFAVPASFQDATGFFLFRIRTICSGTSFSVWSPELRVSWTPPSQTINISIQSISESGGSWVVVVGASQVSVDDITVEGTFLGDANSGGAATFNFNVMIQAGSFTGTGYVSGAAPGGSTSSENITNAQPDPTSNGYDLIY